MNGEFHPTLYTGDAREVMIKSIAPNSIDLIVTSPPYNCKIKYDNWNDELQYNEYLDFMRDWLMCAYDVLKDDGRIAINLFYEISQPGRGGRVFVASDVWQIMKQIGFKWNGIADLKEIQSERTKYCAWGCYDDNTEVLTDSGFKLFKYVDIDRDTFATLNPDSRVLEYQWAFDYIEGEYSGDMYYIRNKTFDLAVTPNHSMVCLRGEGYNRLEMVRADQCLGGNKHLVVPQGHLGWFGGNRESSYMLPIVEKTIPNDNVRNIIDPIPMDDWLTFLGLFLTDGNCYYNTELGQYKVSIYQKKEKYFEDIKNLLARMPFDFVYKERQT